MAHVQVKRGEDFEGAQAYSQEKDVMVTAVVLTQKPEGNM